MLYTMNDQVLHSVRDMQVFSALTASTQLTELQIVESAEDQSIFPLPLPKGALQAMFCPPKQWPFLQALRIEVTDSYGFDMDAVLKVHWCVDAQGIGHLAKCLPALNSLSLVSDPKQTSGTDMVFSKRCLVGCFCGLKRRVCLQLVRVGSGCAELFLCPSSMQIPACRYVTQHCILSWY
jgi:hypothetical protein